MMPLTMANAGEENIIKKVGGKKIPVDSLRILAL